MKRLAAGSVMILAVFGFETTVEAQTDLSQSVQALSSPDASLRTEAVVQLGELGRPESIRPLAVTVRSDPLPSVRQWALHSLAQIGTPEAVEVIRTAVEHDTDPRVRSFAVHRLAELATTEQSEPVIAREPQQVEFGAEPQQVEFGAEPQQVESGAEPRISANATVVVNAPVVQHQITMPTTPTAVPTLSLRATPARPRAGRRLIAIGWSIFGVAYAASFSAFVDDDSGISTIPVFGPFSMGVILLSDPWNEQEVFLGFVSIFTALIQATGFSMGIAGLVRRRRARRSGALDAQRHPRRVSVVPSGLGVGGVF